MVESDAVHGVHVGEDAVRDRLDVVMVEVQVDRRRR